jgi:E3 ubiquitin-protein ligase Topors
MDWSVFSLLLFLLYVFMKWLEQSRRCPLCSQRITEYLIHHIRSKFDYQKHYLTSLRTSPPPAPLQSRAHRNERRERQRRERPWGRRARRDMEERDEADELERAVARRRWVYDHGLYAKVRLLFFSLHPCPSSLKTLDWGTNADTEGTRS